MNNVICPHCGKEVEISQALKHQFNEEEKLKLENEYTKKLELVKQEVAQDSAKKLKEQFEDEIKKTKEDAEEKETRIKKLIDQITELTQELRKSKQERDEVQLTMQKQLLLEREKMQEEMTKTLQEKAGLETAELRKQLEDTKKALEDAQRKAAQKSQQLQGEVLEIELENLLRSAFPQDEIVAVGKGVNGADIKHIVKSPKGFTCGTILWESKRTKEWSDKWIHKLKEDLRVEKAMFPVIVSLNLPKEAENGFGVKEGVWACAPTLVIPLAMILRKNLLDLGYQKAISANRGEKADLLYSYVTSHEFQQQVENVVEVYQEMQTQIVKERAAFEKAWKQREAQAQRILMSTSNMIGSMQGVVGASMPPIKGLDLLEEDDEQKKLID